MRRIIITTLVALTALGGVASADRDRGHRGDGYRWRDNGGVRVDRRHYQRPVYQRPVYQRPYARTYVRPNYRTVYRPRVHVVRQPIYVQRPVINYRYYDYYQRPSVIVENYPTRPGYIWVAGQWTWSGAEWIWQPGHYQPDAAYDQQYYYGQQYNGQQYYDGQYQQPYADPNVNVHVQGSFSF